VSNKDLFCALDEAISKLERAQINVGFWWIDRYAGDMFLEVFPLLIIDINSIMTEPMHWLNLLVPWPRPTLASSRV
jgi:hypothetical protein